MHKNDTIRHYFKMENSGGNKRRSDKRRPNRSYKTIPQADYVLGGHKLIKY